MKSKILVYILILVFSVSSNAQLVQVLATQPVMEPNHPIVHPQPYPTPVIPPAPHKEPDYCSVSDPIAVPRFTSEKENTLVIFEEPCDFNSRFEMRRAQEGESIYYDYVQKPIDTTVYYSENIECFKEAKKTIISVVEEYYMSESAGDNFVKSIKGFKKQVEIWKNIEIFPIFVDRRDFRNYYTNNMRDIIEFETIGFSVDTNSGVFDSNNFEQPGYRMHSWLVISNGKKDFVFSMNNSSYLLQKIIEMMKKKDEQIAKDFYIENEIKDLEKIFGDFLSRNKHSGSIQDYEETKQKLSGIIEKFRSKKEAEQITQEDISLLKNVMLDITDLFTIQGSDVLMNKTYKKYGELKEKLYISNSYTHSYGEKTLFRIDMTEYKNYNSSTVAAYAPEHDLFFDVPVFQVVTNVENRFYRNLTAQYIDRNREVFKRSLQLSPEDVDSERFSVADDKKILQYKNFSEYYSKSEYDRIMSADIGKNLLLAIYALDYMEKNGINELGSDFFNKGRFSAGEWILIGGVALLTIGGGVALLGCISLASAVLSGTITGAVVADASFFIFAGSISAYTGWKAMEGGIFLIQNNHM